MALTAAWGSANVSGVSEGIFTPGLMKFLKDLRANNDREWFEANRARYEEVLLEPSLEFIEAFAPHLRKISPNFVASPRRSGGSLFRIHRDVRFSADKSPYKTHVGISFRHKDAKDVHAPGFYLHIEPRESFVGVGIWHPNTQTLTRIRDAIVDDPRKWKSVVGAKKFAGVYRLTGDSLKRAPTGYDKEHPLVEDLKRKDFIGSARLSDKDITSGELVGSFAGMCRSASGFVGFLCDSVGVPF